MLSTLNTFLSTFIEPARVDSHPERTLQLAIAVLLIEVMKSDAECSDAEQATILKILKKRFLLSDAEVTQLTERGLRTARLNVRIDPAIIGGLTVKLGSRMVDSSLRTKLNAIKHAMKEAG